MTEKSLEQKTEEIDSTSFLKRCIGSYIEPTLVRTDKFEEYSSGVKHSTKLRYGGLGNIVGTGLMGIFVSEFSANFGVIFSYMWGLALIDDPEVYKEGIKAIGPLFALPVATNLASGLYEGIRFGLEQLSLMSGNEEVKEKIKQKEVVRIPYGGGH